MNIALCNVSTFACFIYESKIGSLAIPWQQACAIYFLCCVACSAYGKPNVQLFDKHWKTLFVKRKTKFIEKNYIFYRKTLVFTEKQCFTQINHVFRSKTRFIEKCGLSKNTVIEKLCLSAINWVYQIEKHSLSLNKHFFARKTRFFFNRKVILDKQCFSTAKHGLSAKNSVYRTIVHSACHGRPNVQ